LYVVSYTADSGTMMCITMFLLYFVISVYWNNIGDASLPTG